MLLRPILAATLACAASAAGAGGAAPAATSPAPGTILPAEREMRPLRIEIENGLQFSRLALRSKSDGQAEIDPRTGAKRVSNMIDLGGLASQGRVRITGEPSRPVRIALPTRVMLRAPDGAQATLSNFVTDLPPVAVLDASGTLEFTLGATIATQGASGGDLRRRISIDVDYY